MDRAYLITFALYSPEGIVVAHPEMLDEIGKDQRYRPRDSRHAVDQDVGLLPRLMDEIDRRVEMHTQIVVFMVFSRDVETVWYMFLRMPDMDVLASCQHGLNPMF